MNLERIDEIIAKNITLTDTILYEGVFNAVLEAVETEREACAKVCEDYTDRYAGCEDEGHGYEIAAAIRARGEV